MNFLSDVFFYIYHIKTLFLCYFKPIKLPQTALLTSYEVFFRRILRSPSAWEVSNSPENSLVISFLKIGHGKKSPILFTIKGYEILLQKSQSKRNLKLQIIVTTSAILTQ